MVVLSSVKKQVIFFFLPNSKLTIFPFLFTKHDAIDIADSSSMQDAYHIWTS